MKLKIQSSRTATCPIRGKIFVALIEQAMTVEELRVFVDQNWQDKRIALNNELTDHSRAKLFILLKNPNNPEEAIGYAKVSLTCPSKLTTGGRSPATRIEIRMVQGQNLELGSSLHFGREKRVEVKPVQSISHIPGTLHGHVEEKYNGYTATPEPSSPAEPATNLSSETDAWFFNAIDFKLPANTQAGLIYAAWAAAAIVLALAGTVALGVTVEWLGDGADINWLTDEALGTNLSGGNSISIDDSKLEAAAYVGTGAACLVGYAGCTGAANKAEQQRKHGFTDAGRPPLATP